MRQNFVKYAFVAALMLLLWSCTGPLGEETPVIDISGEWKLESVGNLDGNVEIKSTGEFELSVYLAFDEDGNFELFQRLGERRYRSYSGTWTLEGNVLSGLYGGKQSTPWATSYAVKIEDDGAVLVMSPLKDKEPSVSEEDRPDSSGDVNDVMRYIREPVPESVRAEAVPSGKASL